MLDDTHLSLAAEHHDLVKLGAGAGIGSGLIIQLIQQFGPMLAKLLIDLIMKKNAAVGLKASAPGSIDFSLIKGLIAGLLTSYRGQVITFLDTEENALLDMIIGKLSA